MYKASNLTNFILNAQVVRDGNPIQLDCDDHCTTINVINSLSNKKGFLKMLLHKKVHI